ncbi:hypothetical protein AZF37_08465 [endosymbiont 'TC1' of Trimyema compressum]|nr:hypothetical protein AZF37_08465 [endosymbiont 'TC1' of Trimyema compressum]
MKDKIIYKGWLTLKERLLNKRRYEILVKKDAVAALAEDKEERILLVKQFRPALLRETWEIPAGVMDKAGLDEKAIVIEELSEEANLEVAENQLDFLISFMPEMGISNSKIHLYYTKINYTGTDKTITDDLDVTAIKWFSHKDLEEEIAQGNLLDIKTLLAYYYIKNK